MKFLTLIVSIALLSACGKHLTPEDEYQRALQRELDAAERQATSTCVLRTKSGKTFDLSGYDFISAEGCVRESDTPEVKGVKLW